MLPVLPGTQPTALFESTGFVTGSGGCNAYSTVFQSVATTLSITGPITTTHSLCEQSVMDQEAVYFIALAQTASYRFESDRLALIQSGGAPLAEYGH